MLLTRHEAKVYLDVIAQYHPNKSGIHISYEPNEIRDNIGLLQINSPQAQSDNTQSTAIPKSNIGGRGITARSIEEINQLIPYLSDTLLQTTGKIVFLGNGLSCAPLMIVENNPSAQIIINDMFDYELICEDLQTISKGLSRHEMKDIFAAERHAVKAINGYIKSGQIQNCKYQFGNNQNTTIPPELLDAKVAVNCHGPPYNTLDEQLELLTVGGKLFRTRQHYNGEPYPELDSKQFHTRHFEGYDRTHGYCITRLQ